MKERKDLDMELQLKKEPVYLNEVIFDGQTEQGVEFDYVLPDYYPDIFKILKCSITPGISSYSVSGSQLFIDGAALIRILYLSDDNINIHCVEQKYTYSKTLELTKTAEKADVYITTRTDYSNCRAVSGRRFDVRGAVSCKVKVCQPKIFETISGADGLETKVSSLSYCGSKLTGGGQFTIREDIETGTGKGGIIGILSCDASAEVTDVKIIAGKAVVKGEAKVKALYLVKIDEETRDSEVMEAAVPISRIVDMDGLDDSFSCFADIKIMDCALEVKTGDSDGNRILGCDLTAECKVTASKEKSLSLVTDLFSTEYETDFTTVQLKVEHSPRIIRKQLSYKTELECKEGAVEEIFDCRCEFSGGGCKLNGDGELTVTGQLISQAVGRLSGSGCPVYLEKSEPVELSCDIGTIDENSVIEPNLQITDVSFNISGDAKAELRISISLSGCLYRQKNITVIENVLLDSEKPKEKNIEYALKMYYAEENEEIFAVAKRYNTKPEAIMEENELEDEVLSSPSLLLIPIL